MSFTVSKDQYHIKLGKICKYRKTAFKMGRKGRENIMYCNRTALVQI